MSSAFMQEDNTNKRELSFVSVDSGGIELSADDSSIHSDEKRSARSIYSSLNSYSTPSLNGDGKQTPLKAYISDGIRLNISDGKYLPLHSYSEWFFDYHRKRSPCSKAYLADIKEILLREVKNIDTELTTIDAEKRVLLDIHSFVVNLRNALWESERNSQGLLMPEKLKGIIERTVIDLTNQDDVLSKEIDVPFFAELCKNLKKLTATSNSLQQVLSARIKIEDVEELFSQAGQLYGIVDTILVIFYEKVLESCEKIDVGRKHKNGHPRTQSLNVANGSRNSQGASDDISSSVCVKCMENINLNGADNPPAGCNLMKRGSMGNCRRNSNIGGDGDTKNYPSLRDSGLGSDIFGSFDETEQTKEFIVEMTKDIVRVKKQLKSIDRMTSGRPKMKFLVKKFEEIRNMLRLDEKKHLKKYSYIFEDNMKQLHHVLETEKPCQCDLDNTRFLLSQLGGRATIVLKLETDGLY